MHPGWADTAGVRNWMPVFRALTRPVIRTPEQGADTIVWLGGAPEAVETTGLFWHDRRPRPVTYLIGAEPMMTWPGGNCGTTSPRWPGGRRPGPRKDRPGGHGDGRPGPRSAAAPRPVCQLAGPGAGPASASRLISARVPAMPRSMSPEPARSVCRNTVTEAVAPSPVISR